MRRPEDVVTNRPLNAHTSRRGLAARLTPAPDLFVRNHGSAPEIRHEDWRFTLTGFRRPFELTYADLLDMPRASHDVVLECAGNGRALLAPRTEGTPWEDRAVGCVRFTGTPLASVLDRAGVPRDAVEIVFRGADEGDVPFERSLPVDVALAEDTLVAWAMNGEPLPSEHGGPARLVVPRWYGVASVKWLAEARATATPFEGRYQTDRYVIARDAADPRKEPVREKRVNSLIVEPAADARVPHDETIHVRGHAWSGTAPIARVEVSTDGGETWTDATLDAPTGPHAWTTFHLATRLPAGPVTLLSRAWDEAGNAQPDAPEWNWLGYANHAVKARRVLVSRRLMR